MTRRIKWLWGLAFTSVITGILAGAAEVLNESFESPVVSGRGNQITPTGWKRVLTGYSTVWNEDTSGATTSYGAQMAATWINTGFQTTNITEVVQPGATYTLTFNVGNCDTDTGNARTDNQYTAEILAGETVLASVSGSTNTDNLSQSNVTSVVIGAGHASLGQTLGVRLRMTGGHWKGLTLFDNVRLTAVESDEWKRSLIYGK